MFVFQAFFLILFHLLQKLTIVPVKKELGLAFKGDHKMVVEALEVFCYICSIISCFNIIYLLNEASHLCLLYLFTHDLPLLQKLIQLEIR